MKNYKKCRYCDFEAFDSYGLTYFDSKSNCCKKCKVEYTKAHKYGITPEEYKERMATSVVCQICDRSDDLVYDHDHESGKFRGVLCRNCNIGLGQFKDDIKTMAKAIEYLSS